jgi:hypothetical protein
VQTLYGGTNVEKSSICGDRGNCRSAHRAGGRSIRNTARFARIERDDREFGVSPASDIFVCRAVSCEDDNGIHCWFDRFCGELLVDSVGSAVAGRDYGVGEHQCGGDNRQHQRWDPELQQRTSHFHSANTCAAVDSGLDANLPFGNRRLDRRRSWSI